MELIERRGLISIAVVCLYVTGFACVGFWVLGVWTEMRRQYKSCFYFISFLFRLLRSHRCMALLMICLPTQHTSRLWFRAGCVCVWAWKAQMLFTGLGGCLSRGSSTRCYFPLGSTVSCQSYWSESWAPSSAGFHAQTGVKLTNTLKSMARSFHPKIKRIKPYLFIFHDN